MLYRFFIKNGQIVGYCPIDNVHLMGIEYDHYVDKDFEKEGYFVYNGEDVVIGELPPRPDFI